MNFFQKNWNQNFIFESAELGDRHVKLMRRDFEPKKKDRELEFHPFYSTHTHRCDTALLG